MELLGSNVLLDDEDGGEMASFLLLAVSMGIGLSAGASAGVSASTECEDGPAGIF